MPLREIAGSPACDLSMEHKDVEYVIEVSFKEFDDPTDEDAPVSVRTVVRSYRVVAAVDARPVDYRIAPGADETIFLIFI